MSQLYEQSAPSARTRLFAEVAALSRRTTPFARVANWVNACRPVRRLLRSFVGITDQGPLPQYATETFARWWGRRASQAGAEAGVVALFADTFTQYYEPEVGRAAVAVMERLGASVRVPEVVCCGRPLISSGFLKRARQLAAINVERLASLAAAGTPIIVLEPSCLSTFRDEYREFGLGEAAATVADAVTSLEEWAAARLPRPSAKAGRCLLHGHCHQKALWGTEATLAALRAGGYQAEEIPSGCCGMAGAFGYKREHYDLSLQIGELGLLPRVREAAADTLLVAPGTSCRHQIARATGRTAVHPAVALARALK